MYVLDTDILIYYLKGNDSVIKQVQAVPEEQLYTTLLNHSELYFGAYNSKRVNYNLACIEKLLANLKLLPFCEKSSILFAELKSDLKRQGNIIADVDLMIASIALQNDMKLITNNLKHFERIRGLSLVNWA